MTVDILVSPLSNDPLRDWPIGHFRTLAGFCVDRLGATLGFVGTGAQRDAVAPALRGLPAARAVNLCGTTSWAEVGALARAARCVVANNSGVAHLAAGLGAPTVCVFAASHSPFEWMPRGSAVTTLVKRTGCAPCAIAALSDCPFDHRCMREIGPETVFAAVARHYAEGSPAAG